MTRRTLILVLATAALAVPSATAWSQQSRSGERAAQTTQERQMERMQSREHMKSAEQLQQRDQDRLQEQEKDQEKTQDRLAKGDGDKDQLQERDRDRIHQDEIFGSEMMTEQERMRYQEQIQSATSEEQRAQIRAKHREQMQQRAKERGIDLDEPGGDL